MIGDGPGPAGVADPCRFSGGGLHALRRVAPACGHPCRGGLLESGELSGAELDACCGGVLLQVRRTPCAMDRYDVLALREHPGHAS